MNFKTTLIILAIFVLLVVSYLLFLRGEPDAEKLKGDPQKISAVYGLDRNKIRRIRLSYKDESYPTVTLVKNVDGIWQLTAPVTDDADQPKINEMLRDLLDKKVKRTLEVTDLSQYGLDNPTIQIEVWTTSPPTPPLEGRGERGGVGNASSSPLSTGGGESPAKTFLIGKKGINYSVYAKEKSDPKIILIESSALDDFTKSPSDLRERTALKFSPDAVSGFALQVSGQAEIRCEKGDVAGNLSPGPSPTRRGEKAPPSIAGKGVGGLGSQWKMIQPLEAKADTKEIESILSVLNTLKVTAFEADGQIDPAKYGLEPPRVKVTLQLTDKGTRGLLIGAEAKTPGQVYAKRTDRNSIYSVDQIYAQLNKTAFDLRDKRVMDFQRTETNRFEIQTSGRKIVCEKSIDGQWEIKAPVQLKANQTVVDDLLFGVDSLKAVEFVSEHPRSLQPYGLDAPSFQVSFMQPPSEPAVLLVGNTKGDTVYVKAKNADTVFLVKKESLNPIRIGVEEITKK
ncbi:DUF4340 domain-containing protein [Candidatus Poribacteria bacterium]|nr:DUF4340 domain-containing protein [Candidatus Poribacteria bacterium]